MFTDDSKLLSLIFAASFIQHNIDLFLKWAEQNSLKVHPGKSQVIVFSGHVTNVFLNSGKKVVRSNRSLLLEPLRSVLIPTENTLISGCAE